MGNAYRSRGTAWSYCSTQNGTYVALPGVHEGDIPSDKLGTFDRTAVDDAGLYRSKGMGEKEPGSATFLVEYLPATFAALQAIVDAQDNAGTIYWWKAVLVKAPGIQTVSGDAYTQQGIITGLNVRRVTQAVNETQMIALDIEWTGAKYRVQGS